MFGSIVYLRSDSGKQRPAKVVEIKKRGSLKLQFHDKKTKEFTGEILDGISTNSVWNGINSQLSPLRDIGVSPTRGHGQAKNMKGKEQKEDKDDEAEQEENGKGKEGVDDEEDDQNNDHGKGPV